MTYKFNNFRATKPVVRLIDAQKRLYEVFFIVYDSQDVRHTMRYKKGINNLAPADRQAQAKANANVFWEGLQNGWNPLVLKYPIFEKEKTRILELTFSTALDFCLRIKSPELSKWSIYDYKGCVKFMKKAAHACECDQTPIRLIKRKDIRAIVATAKEQRDWTAKARNKYLSILGALLSVLEDEEVVEFSPVRKIKKEKEGETIGYKRLTDDQTQAIYEKLSVEHLDYFEYLMFIYQPLIRRKENLLIRIKDLDLQRREITIREEVAKTNRERKVPITDDIMDILIRREVWSLPKEWFLFSSNKFKPGPEEYHPNTPTNWWRNLVIKGMGIDCKMYSLKHKGADDKIKAKMPLDVIKTIAGHKSKQMTEVYATAVREKYKEQIIADSPTFAKVVRMEKKTS